MQWKPDYLAAATMYERSADLYKQAEDLSSAMLIMLKAAECHEGYNAMASVAVANTKAAQFNKEIGPGREKRTAELLIAAAEFWGLSGDLAKYGEALAKAAKELENVDAKGAHELYMKAMKVLCPDNKPQSPAVVEIVRNIFSFLVRNRLFNEALEFSTSAVAIFLASQLEGSAFKILAAVTVIQLAQGDAVKAQQTYLQEHLNVPGYLNSRECELADNLTMAFSANDQEKLEKAIKSPEMRYLDFEVQVIGKTLSLFDACYTDDATVDKTLPSLPTPSFNAPASSSGSSGKSDLFAKPASKSDSSSINNASVSAPNQPPPPPASTYEDSDDLAYGENGECVPADLGEVEIPDYDSDKEVPGIRKLSISEPVFEVASAPTPAEEDEDEIDLS